MTNEEIYQAIKTVQIRNEVKARMMTNQVKVMDKFTGRHGANAVMIIPRSIGLSFSADGLSWSAVEYLPSCTIYDEAAFVDKKLWSNCTYDPLGDLKALSKMVIKDFLAYCLCNSCFRRFHKDNCGRECPVCYKGKLVAMYESRLVNP